MEYMKEEKKRQEKLGLVNQFVIPAGTSPTRTLGKLTAAQVETIRKEAADGASRAELARQFEVSWNMVQDIVEGRKWKVSKPSPYLGKPAHQHAPHEALHRIHWVQVGAENYLKYGRDAMRTPLPPRLA